MRPWLTILARLTAAAAAVAGLRAWAALAKLAGDLVTVTLLRRSMVFFYEDLFWELIGFVLLGLLGAGLILLVENLVGGPIQPYLPALGVYLAYMLAEGGRYGAGEGR